MRPESTFVGSQPDPLLSVVDQPHADALRLAAAAIGIVITDSVALRLTGELDRFPDPNAEAEAMVGRRFRGVRGITVPAQQLAPRTPRRLPSSVSNYLARRHHHG